MLLDSFVYLQPCVFERHDKFQFWGVPVKACNQGLVS